MKKLFLELLLGLALLTLPRGSAFAQTTDPVQIVKDYITTANTGDYDKTLAFYAEDAIVKNGLGLFVGKAQLAGWLKQDVQTTRATPQMFQVTGNLVVNTGTVSLARFKTLGIDPVQYRAEYVIENGKIRYFSPVVLLTPDQQAKVQASTAGTPVPTVPAGQADPLQVVKDYITTANTGDFAKTDAFYAEDAIVKNGLGLFVGKDQVSPWLKQDVQTTRATPQMFQATGNMVVNTGSVSLARFEPLGINPVQYRAEYVIENGKIRYFSPLVLLTPDQQAKVQAASNAATNPAPATLPVTGVSLSSDMNLWVLAVGISILLIGFALFVVRAARRV